MAFELSLLTVQNIPQRIEQIVLVFCHYVLDCLAGRINASI